MRVHRCRFRRAVSLAGVDDLHWAWEHRTGGGVVEIIGGTPAKFPERYAAASPAALLPLGVRQVLIHGTRDDIVPFEIGRVYHAAAARGDEVALIPLPDAGHFEVADPGSREWAAVREAVLDLIEAETHL